MPLAVPDFLNPLLGRPAAVFGGAASGRAAAELLQALGAAVQIYDEKGAGAEARRDFGPGEARRHDLVVFSPGFAPDHPWLAAARAGGSRCLGELDFGSLFWRGRIVAITGTNGKTTLTEFLTHALRAAGAKAFAAGNLGHPLSRLALEAGGGDADALAVCEVSSFQAETLQHFRAEAALWTNFAEDHLERHPGMSAYFRAKARLAERADAVFAGSSVRAYLEEKTRGESSRIRENLAVLPNSHEFGYFHGPFFAVDTQNLPADPQLAGTVFAEYPQRENFALAAAWWAASGRGKAELYGAARSFRLGRHRLARVAEVDGVTYWNDSKATNFHAVEAALGRFPSPVLLIAGGKSKGGDLAGFVRRIAPKVREVFLIGETGPALAALCAEAGVRGHPCGALGEAVALAAAAAASGDQVLLSPGFASFDQFRGYEDRGDQFEQRVRELEGAAALK
jgi:UDP-N-acetylmuramoylalanine--D-glutamate ligase